MKAGPAAGPPVPEAEIEALIAALTGVLAARVVVSPVGRIDEVHVLADEQLHPKQMVRNIESALSAGLALGVDRRLISVAQVRGETDSLQLDVASGSGGAEPGAAGGHAAGTDASAGGANGSASGAAITAAKAAPAARDVVSRYVFVGYDARVQPDLESVCRVTIRRGSEAISGSGTGPSTALGRAQAGARAVFAAIAAARRDHALGLEGVTLIEGNGRRHVLVAAHAAVGRGSVPLTGVAALHRSPEEAAILASLQATNRWAELDG